MVLQAASIPIAEDNRQPLYSIRGLKKRFSSSPGGVEALSGVDLDIYRGECLLIAGANGSGKTLLTRILAGLLEATEGEILFNGKPVEECKGQIRHSVGLVFQDSDTQILGETVEEDIRFGPENLKLPKEEVESRLEETLSLLGLSEKRDFASRHLSGGEKRRLAVAGVLAMGCETIIMDEPFANMDWPGVIQVLKIISLLKQSGKTAIILTHELEKVLEFADRLVILWKGRIRDSGGAKEVLERLNPEWGVRDPGKVYISAGDRAWL
jgi:biotin transport system ATP-binding protein